MKKIAQAFAKFKLPKSNFFPLNKFQFSQFIQPIEKAPEF